MLGLSLMRLQALLFNYFSNIDNLNYNRYVNGYKMSQGDREALYNFINALSDSDLQFIHFFFQFHCMMNLQLTL
jgi:hypothetical protein